MRAAKCSGYGEVFEAVLEVVDDFPPPDFEPSAAQGFALIRTHACALAPGDVRVVSGKTREFQGPPAMPFVPGGDVSGVVAAVADGEPRLRMGDAVVARFNGSPRGGLAEYTVVKTALTTIKPNGVDFCHAAAIASSGVAALVLAKMLNHGDRVLILGGSGGVGSDLVQLARRFGASFVAATSSDVQLVRRLGADDAVDYREHNVWELERYKREPFDVVIDLVGGGWHSARRCSASSPGILKCGRDGGRFWTLTPDTAWFEMHSIADAIRVFLAPALWRRVYTFFNRSIPRYQFVLALPEGHESRAELLALIESRALDVTLDPAGPFPFTTAGVRAAFDLQASRHARGKAVVSLLS